MCGEKGLPTLRYSPQSGSPPHVRGKEQQLTNAADQVRITPAYAGKSTPTAGRFGQCRDHPRTCGEKGQRPLHGRYPLGSPPHMRGKVLQNGVLAFEFGITPACAGK